MRGLSRSWVLPISGAAFGGRQMEEPAWGMLWPLPSYIYMSLHLKGHRLGIMLFCMPLNILNIYFF